MEATLESGLRVQVVGSGDRGDGCVATRKLQAGDTVCVNRPKLGRQTPESRRAVLACGNPRCISPIGPPAVRLELLAGRCSRATLAGVHGGSVAAELAAAGCRWCAGGCGECYCSDGCQVDAAPAHKLLCVGLVPDGQPDHPILKFKMHALQTNEAFLLAADAVTHVISESVAKDGAAKTSAQAVERSAKIWLELFVPRGEQAVWWDARRPMAWW